MLYLIQKRLSHLSSSTRLHRPFTDGVQTVRGPLRDYFWTGTDPPAIQEGIYHGSRSI